nr:MAG TPA: hypothetical protein [Caudoviricetes sp.]
MVKVPPNLRPILVDEAGYIGKVTSSSTIPSP